MYINYLLKIEDILLGLFILTLLFQLGYHWIIFARLSFFKFTKKESSFQPVSVVIVARNEYHNLLKTLEPILNQDYPEFEVVVVNDHSDDETHEYLQDLSKKYPRLKTVRLDQSLNFFSGKKFPLSIGIKSAHYETLLLTDADCQVVSDKWIMSMQASFQPKTEIVLGYGPYLPKSGLLDKIIRFDTFMAALHYLSFALMRMPYMGVGRNLAYSKKMFYERKGFINHYKINSGDDDLFINQAASKTNTAICICPESMTYSIQEKSLSLWLLQKKRHLSTSGMYKTKHRILLMIYPITLFLFYGFTLALLLLKSWLIVLAVLFSLRLISFLIIQKSALQKLKEQKLLIFSPILELLIYSFQGLVMTLNFFNSGNKWK